MGAAPPSSPRARRASLAMPDWGSLHRRHSDGRLFHVAKVYPRDLQVRLDAAVGCGRLYVFVSQLWSDFTDEPTR